MASYVTVLRFISFRLMNAELEAKTADLVRQAEQLMVSCQHWSHLLAGQILSLIKTCEVILGVYWILERTE